MGPILSQQEVVQLIAQYQARILSLVPKAIAAFEEVLDSDNLHLKAATAAKLLEGIGALHKGGAEHIVENASTTPEQQRRQQRLLVLGSMTEMMLLKSKRYGTSLPPELEGLKDELNRCFETPHPGSAAE